MVVVSGMCIVIVLYCDFTVCVLFCVMTVLCRVVFLLSCMCTVCVLLCVAMYVDCIVSCCLALCPHCG